ncbi:leucine-rich repeat (LRR) family protein [Striga asiatica]|uniref:Leucine-rich repeat (LRR) family protein n=1 Tax=Striga asiatica TaxID=4170 RepID=A0A5A7NZL4_STRAF|nr:leucine-rich repeat (LRR) family protein [Striga asiatica]
MPPCGVEIKRQDKMTTYTVQQDYVLVKLIRSKKQKPSTDDSHPHPLPLNPPLTASASCEEVRSILKFRKGIKSDPSDVFFSWVPHAPADASACPDDFYGVVCYTAASAVAQSNPAPSPCARQLQLACAIAP